MSHEVETMFYQGETPWHTLGNPIPEDKRLSVDEGIIAAGCDWEVGLIPLCASVLEADYEGHPDGLFAAISGQNVPAQMTYRKTDLRRLGVVGPNYHVLQNRRAFEFFQPFLDSGEAELHTGGSLCEGAKVWVLAKLNRDPLVVAKGDEVVKYLLLSNSHDGTTAVRVGFTPIRVVCANTLAAATQDGASQLLRIRHTGNMEESLEQIRDIINVANASFEATGEQYRFLASRGINQDDLDRYVRVVLNITEKTQKDGTKGISTRAQNIMDDIFGRFEAGIGSDKVAVKGTYWNAYNAVNEWLNYERGHNKASRLQSLWFGDSANINLRALSTATKMADKHGVVLAA